MSALEYDPSQTALYHPEAQPSVFASVPAQGDLSLAVEAARLAYLRTEESDAARLTLKITLSSQGFGQPEYFRHGPTGSEGFGTLRDDGSALIALRGTQIDRIKDLISDVQVMRMTWTLRHGQVHSGFAKAALGLWPSIQTWLDDTAHQRTSLTITGHSLGAAIATLLAEPAGADLLVTLGSPRVGDPDFTQGLAAQKKLRVMRLVDCCDVVTELVPASLGFDHVHGLGYIDHNGVLQASFSEAQILEDQEKARVDYLMRYARHPENVFLRDWADHAPINYVLAFW